ncbi:carbohydrate ABC transporter substrate-binding protein, CUT1 family [Psychromonas ingrahamii 37]|uniref:Carbohydrate ABC transporter substrate-binding protein, CUT1 family n=1 Tax=Psychromonas ingrahamii (strain DSM 17664 / CCUG 51855 / 37) TaxID=357804 RepID=A1SXL7_PSYIN|nr:extracellular solute-binding protein [Psychromonas ingrahamii]ABM04232.1 carbohydrate ABC transporter substrate-binding protein, CUT1 family [Psychromonas ingrahamii 37]
MKKVTLTIALALFSAQSLAEEVTVGRFFGACEEVSENISEATGEACIIQSIIDGYSKADNGNTARTLPTNWGNYYAQIKTAYSGGTPPNVHVMHRHRLPEFADLGALQALSAEVLKNAGIDSKDWTQSALDAVTYKGKIYGVPMDLHANLWHINIDLMQKAGLVDKAGKAILPGSPQELIEHAKQMKEKTGEDYLAADFAQFPVGVRFVLALLWQQDSNIFDTKGNVTVNTPEMRTAVNTVLDLFKQKGADPRLNYTESQQKFIDGKSAVLVNGTWAVDLYTAQAKDNKVPLANYQVADFPTLFKTPATWADTHMWVVPAKTAKNKAKFDASLGLLAWINNHNLDWSRTGHMAVRNSVLNSEEYQELDHRDEYIATKDRATDTPPSTKYGAIQDILNRELQSIWLTGKSVDMALEDAQYDIEDIM